jgi:hypothetical protein
MKGYTDKNSVERYMLVDIDSSFNTQIDEWIEVAESIIDNYTGRNFIADTSYSSKNYNGDGTHILLVDDFVELEKIEMGDPAYPSLVEELDSDNYHIYPLNETPKNKIYYDYAFSVGEENVEVSAKWGYSVSCPADIKLAATILVSFMIEEAWESQSETESETIGSYSITYNKSNKNTSKFDRLKSILDSYKRIHF